MNDKYVSLGDRVASERKRLGYTQAQVAALCEVSRVQWGRYEREESELGGRVLKAFGDLGANVNFILTGEQSTNKLIANPRINNDLNPQPISDDEWELIQMYRRLDISNKGVIKAMVKALPDAENVVVTNTNADNSGNQGYINQGVVKGGSIGSVSGGIANIHNNESGFTQLPFLYACIFCCSLAWVLAVMANLKLVTDVTGSMAFGIPALVIWAIGFVLAIFGYQIGMKQHKQFNEDKEVV